MQVSSLNSEYVLCILSTTVASLVSVFGIPFLIVDSRYTLISNSTVVYKRHGMLKFLQTELHTSTSRK